MPFRSRLVPIRAFLPHWVEEDVTAFLHRLVQEHRQYQYGKFTYVFVEPETLEIDQNSFLVVTLAKIRREHFAQYFDPEKWRLVERPLPGMRSEERSFLLIGEDGLLIVEERKPWLRMSLIARVISGFAEEAFETIGRLVLTPLGVTADVLATISGWEGVTRIRFRELQTSNPEARRVFERMERVLRDANAEKTTIVFSNEEGALNTAEDSLIRSGIELSNEGYGEYSIEGEQEGQAVSVSKRHAILKHRVQYGTMREWADAAIALWKRIRRGGE